MKNHLGVIGVIAVLSLLSSVIITGCPNVTASEETYTVTYNGNSSSSGGVPSDSQKYSLGQTVTVLGNTGALAKAGNSFNGWNTKADGTGVTYPQGSTFIMGSDDVVLYALWMANTTFTVIYNGNGNTAGRVPADTTNYIAGQTVTVIGNTGTLTKTGSTFVGWNTISDGSGTTYSQGQTFAMGSANVVLFAEWTTLPTYTVTYDGNTKDAGTVPVDSTNYLRDQTITFLPNSGNLTKSGYSFAGWSLGTNPGSTVYPPATTLPMGEANIVLYARWTANVYTVTFDSQSATVASSPTSKTVTYPATTIDALSTAPTKTGYTFGGWYTATNGGGTAFTASSVVSASTTVYAKWNANVYTVTFDSQSATVMPSPSTKSVTYPATTIDALPTPPTKTGYTFGGWYTAINGGGQLFTAFTQVSSDTTIYAYWQIPKVETPSFSLSSGNYTGLQVIEISCATQNAEIYYTFNNTTATTSDTRYTGPISIEIDQHIAARAFKSGMTMSDNFQVNYRIFSDNLMLTSKVVFPSNPIATCFSDSTMFCFSFTKTDYYSPIIPQVWAIDLMTFEKSSIGTDFVQSGNVGQGSIVYSSSGLFCIFAGSSGIEIYKHMGQSSWILVGSHAITSVSENSLLASSLNDGRIAISFRDNVRAISSLLIYDGTNFNSVDLPNATADYSFDNVVISSDAGIIYVFLFSYNSSKLLMVDSNNSITDITPSNVFSGKNITSAKLLGENVLFSYQNSTEWGTTYYGKYNTAFSEPYPPIVTNYPGSSPSFFTHDISSAWAIVPYGVGARLSKTVEDQWIFTGDTSLSTGTIIKFDNNGKPYFFLSNSLYSLATLESIE